MYRFSPHLRFFLVHPGGPFYQKKNEGFWTIPKGLREGEEELLIAAQREFREETGINPSAPFQSLGFSKTKAGKLIHAWAFQGQWEESQGIVSNSFDLEWPPRSGKRISVPEADKGKWCSYEEALQLIHSSQLIFIETAFALLNRATEK